MYHYYHYFRQIRTIGRLRAWHASKTDRHNWDEAAYPPPPEMRYPGITIKDGSWADITPSKRVGLYSCTRGKTIESTKKLRRLRKRRLARKYRIYQKRTGKL